MERPSGWANSDIVASSTRAPQARIDAFLTPNMRCEALHCLANSPPRGTGSAWGERLWEFDHCVSDGPLGDTRDYTFAPAVGTPDGMALSRAACALAMRCEIVALAAALLIGGCALAEDRIPIE
jgi:hypothetical protein